MTIEEACGAILGEKAAHDIIMDMGVHWAVVAAMAAALTSHPPEALKTLRDYNARNRS